MSKHPRLECNRTKHVLVYRSLQNEPRLSVAEQESAKPPEDSEGPFPQQILTYVFHCTYRTSKAAKRPPAMGPTQ